MHRIGEQHQWLDRMKAVSAPNQVIASKDGRSWTVMTKDQASQSRCEELSLRKMTQAVQDEVWYWTEEQISEGLQAFSKLVTREQEALEQKGWMGKVWAFLTGRYAAVKEGQKTIEDLSLASQPEKMRQLLDQLKEGRAPRRWRSVPLAALTHQLTGSAEYRSEGWFPQVLAEAISAIAKTGQSLHLLESLQEASISAPIAAPLQETIALADQTEKSERIHLDGLDAASLKNGSMVVQKRKMDDGESRFHLEVELTTPIRAEIESFVRSWQRKPQLVHEALPDGFCQGVEVKTEVKGYFRRQEDGVIQGDPVFTIGKNQTVKYEGKGKVMFGSSTAVRTNYRRLEIELDASVPADQVLETVQTMLAPLGLVGVLSPQDETSDTRIKILTLLRLVDPRGAMLLEKEAKSLRMPLEELEERAKALFNKNSKVGTWDTCIARMYKQEVQPGKNVWALGGFAQSLREAGAMGLMTGVGGGVDHVLSMLKKGALSTKERYADGMLIKGASIRERLPHKLLF